jgi:hypothetical protein
VLDRSTENHIAWTAACCRSAMNDYELLLHPREQDFSGPASREIDQLFAKLLGLATGIHEEIYS